MDKTLPAWIAAGCLAFTVAAQPETTKATAPEPPDLRTRVSGSDWPTFMGPTGDGKSIETIRTDWPLKVRWHQKVGRADPG